MALQEIAPSAPALTYERINAAIRALNVLNEAIMGVQQDTKNATSLSIAASNGVRSLADLIKSTEATLSARMDQLSDRVTADFLVALVALLQGESPGLSPTTFTASALGSAAQSQPLDPTNVVRTALGLAHITQGAGLIATRATIAIDPDAIYLLRARCWRQADVLDPNNNAVDLGIQWLDADDGHAGRTLVHRETNLQRHDGPQTFTVRVPSEAGAQPMIAPPKGAVSWRPYMQTYGADGATAISVFSATEITFAGFYAPDVVALASRLGTIEGQIAAGLPFSTPILPSFAVADLPGPGTPGRKAFARDGRAPNAAGAMEAANAGTGVEVVDNGSKWVISGTNQAVQA